MNALTPRFGSGFEQFEDRLTPSRAMGEPVALAAPAIIRVEAAPEKVDAAARTIGSTNGIKVQSSEPILVAEGTTAARDSGPKALSDAGPIKDNGDGRRGDTRADAPPKETKGEPQPMEDMGQHGVKVG